MQAQTRVWRTLSLVLLTIAACLRAESTAYADAAARWTDAQLVGFSDVILRGRVVRVASGADDRVGAIYTYVSIDVSEVLKGRLADSRVTIKLLGGRAGSTELRIAGQSEFAVGEDVLAFLEVRPRDRTLATTAAWQGKFTIVHAPEGDTAVRRDPGAEARGVFGDQTRAVASWLPLLRSLIGSAPSNAGEQPIEVAPRDSRTATTAVTSSGVAEWPERQLRLDLVSARP